MTDKVCDPNIGRADLDSILLYDRETGQFTWKVDRGWNAKAGQRAGHKEPGGYYRITINKQRVLAHRIAWMMCYGEWPNGFIDHIDGDPSNNSIGNLRVATKQQNSRNKKTPKHNKLGLKGVYESKNPNRVKKFVAVVKIGKRQRTIGYFHTPEEAKAAYDNEARAIHGAFYRQ